MGIPIYMRIQQFILDKIKSGEWAPGATIPTEAEGWTLVTVDGLSLGWGKGVRGTLKNHYPKGLRTQG